MRHVECPHALKDLLEKERKYIPAIGKASDGLVWCDDCKTWVGFEVDWAAFNASQSPKLSESK